MNRYEAVYTIHDNTAHIHGHILFNSVSYFMWSDMIKRDLDACILQAATYESFLSLLSGLGYGIKNAYQEEGRYLAIKPM